MTKQLLIMRHAKSSWANVNISDHERTLNARGLRDAPRMGQWISAQNLVPDLVLSSTATRAVETANLFVENCGVPASQLVLLDEFYHAGPRTYLEHLVRLNNDSLETVMVVGHNPGLEELVMRLSGDFETLPTAAIVLFRLRVKSWAMMLDTNNAEMVTVWRPKEIF